MKPIVRKILALVIVVAVGAVAGPWVYINLIKDARQNQLQRLLPSQQQRLHPRAPSTATGK